MGSSNQTLYRTLETIKRHLRIAVIHGGDSALEGAVIRRTFNPRGTKRYELVAQDIANALRRVGFEYVELIPEDLRLSERLKQADIGLAWLNTGGTQGFFSISHAAAILELCGIPYIGHNPLNAALLDSKHIFKALLASLNIPTPVSVVCDFKNIQTSDHICDRDFDETFKNCHQGFIVKPVSGRASLHVHFAREKKEAFKLALEVSLQTSNLVLIEEFIPGMEYTIAVSGGIVFRQHAIQELHVPFTFSALRRHMAAGELIFPSMDGHPIKKKHIELLNAKQEPRLLLQLTELAQTIYRQLHLETLVRIDIRADQQGQLFVLEANPKPDLRQASGENVTLALAGLEQQRMSYDDLILTILVNHLHFLLTHRPAICGHIIELIQ